MATTSPSPKKSPPKKKQPPAKAKVKKQPPAKAKKGVTSHTDDGTPIVNATMAQLRKGLNGKATQQLVRIPQVAERSNFYAEAAEVIGERESLALPYHGGRMWQCEVKVSDEDGACGTNRKGKGKNNDNDESSPKKKKNNYKSLTPLFRWYRGDLILATLPYILEDIIEVECKMPSKKKWANGMSDDEGLDSSDEEWDDEAYKVEPEIKMTMDISALTQAAYEDSSHPMPSVSRMWISPDMQKFPSRKSAMAHSESLVKRDLLIDRTLYGYGHNGVRLRPVKPTKKQALEAGTARFLRDGLWVVGQEEMWVEKRRDVLVKKQEKRASVDGLKKEEDENDSVEDQEDPADAEGGQQQSEGENKGVPVNDEEIAPLVAEKKVEAKSCVNEEDDLTEKRKAAARAAVGYVHPRLDASSEKGGDMDSMERAQAVACAAAGYVCPESDAPADQSTLDDSKPAASSSSSNGESANVISPPESDASSNELSAKMPQNEDDDATTNNVMVKHVKGSKPPPAFIPSTHHRLNVTQIDMCYTACIDHYESVMRTVKARSLHHELADGFDVLRERGRGRFDMELSQFDTPEYSFLTDPRKAPWMPIVKQILGDDATLVHKGCFMSLPGSETQVYHQDGVHLNKKTHKPCYAINVFVPLVDYDMTNGPTEFCLGTHYLECENFVKENVYTPCVTAGTPVIFDYRLGHRGLRNYSQAVRPVVYLTYSSVASGKEFRDSVNFSRKRYHKLGDFAEKPLSREERRKKRQRK